MGDGQNLSLRLQASQFSTPIALVLLNLGWGDEEPVQFSTSLSHTVQYRYDYLTGRADKSQYFQISGLTLGLAKRLKKARRFFYPFPGDLLSVLRSE